jgi:hypothetical protein
MEMDVLGNARSCKHGSDAGTTRNHALIYYMDTSFEGTQFVLRPS